MFSLRHLIGTMPKAVLFQLSFCLLLYNTLQVVRAHLASHQNCEAKKISNEKVFYDVKRQMVAVDELVDLEALLALLGEVPTAVSCATACERVCETHGAIAGGRSPVPAVAGTRRRRRACSATIRRPTVFSSKHRSKRMDHLETARRP